MRGAERIDPHLPDNDRRAARRGVSSTRRAGLDVADVAADPLQQWRRWYDDASAAGVAEPNAMTIATVGLDGHPDARTVLARGADDRSLVFFTNYDSAKSRQLDAHPHAAAVFAWLDLHRQVRLRGGVERVDDDESDDYFASRPREQPARRLGVAAERGPRRPCRARAPASPSAAERFADGDVPRPPFWGGWRLVVDDGRVLAGPAEQAARPRPLPARRRSAG